MTINLKALKILGYIVSLPLFILIVICILIFEKPENWPSDY